MPARSRASALRAAIEERAAAVWAVSGGRTPWVMLAELARERLEWGAVTMLQVDERVAPDGDPDRNLTHLRAAMGDRGARIEPMDVTAPDLDAAAARYADVVPAAFDVVHLGLGPDGHTASLVPGDAVLRVDDQLVGVTQPYQGHRRMTLTYPALARARLLVWLVTGAEKRDALGALLAGDTSIPAGSVRAGRSIVLADAAAAG